MPSIPPAPILATAFAVLLAACVMPTKTPPQTGPEDFEAYCASCHGLDGRGGGEMADVLDRRPADLTRLAAGNGGTYPKGRVMAKIWGYAKPDGTTVMPSFGPLLEGDMLRYDAGDGIATPTPIRLVQLAEYVERIQE
ncbi:c-type cytochrome [Fertoebacter nigrum]|uniref:C-type cytochrome n=1 Tax=Fertoeibacter niger TaxID=2656921 RepID=A0A8X8GY37_9RHOB|nr:c-type cytochrome [Fertoeibacter niger]NUB43948.1 c-type cytochrome [Fertoeibacter niger]